MAAQRLLASRTVNLTVPLEFLNPTPTRRLMENSREKSHRNIGRNQPGVDDRLL